MGDGFEVSGDVLNRLASDLASVGDQIDSAMKGMDHAGDLGTGELTSACDDFKHRWEYGVKELKKKVDGIKDNVSSTAKAYDEAESHVAAGLARYSAR